MNRLVNGSCGSGSSRIRSIPSIQELRSVVVPGTPVGCTQPSRPIAASSTRTILDLPRNTCFKWPNNRTDVVMAGEA
jgi:hypothetical protein